MYALDTVPLIYIIHRLIIALLNIICQVILKNFMIFLLFGWFYCSFLVFFDFFWRKKSIFGRRLTTSVYFVKSR